MSSKPLESPRPAAGTQGAASSGLRIALYSHDTLGIGHLRRNLHIARALSQAGDPAGILLIAGAREAGCFPIPPGVDCLTLPSLSKDAQGRYGCRSLGVTLERLIQLRSASLAAALESFAPDVLIVDKVPRGALNELDRALDVLRGHGQTRCVLGLREVLDDPATVRREWQHQRSQQALRDYYDAIWVYGDPRVYDPVREYGLNVEAQLPVRYTGYLDPSGTPPATAETRDGMLQGLGLPPGRMALCVVGGGQDGAALAEAFCDADRPADMNAVIVTGPFMPTEWRERLRQVESVQPRFRVLDFVADPVRLLRMADRVISMGGYNTVCEVLALGKQALVVPRVHPRREQLIRAERLRDLKLLDVLLPDRLSPAALSNWLSQELPARPSAHEHIDFAGLARLPELLTELMATKTGSPATTRQKQETCLVTS